MNRLFPRKLHKKLLTLGMEKISFREGITFGELKQFVHFLASGKEDPQQRKWECISYGAIHTFEGPPGACRELGLAIPAYSAREVGLAALLHDIGKEAVPQEILRKPGKISADDFARIADHPVHGAHQLRKDGGGSIIR